MLDYCCSTLFLLQIPLTLSVYVFRILNFQDTLDRISPNLDRDYFYIFYSTGVTVTGFCSTTYNKDL